MCYIFTKMDWATFWATVSQTHLVPLPTIESEACFLKRAVPPV
jgi:hypothetical protein